MDQLNKAQKDGVVVGLKAVAGVVPRLDIDKLLIEAPDTFNLFCLALADLMSADDNGNIMGYYQIAGIHGLPKVLWDNIDAPNKEPGSLAGSGYCAHSSLQFPPWHRPYLSMIEQTIFKKMVDLAETFPEADKQTYRDAAKKFRLPYWDYYRPRGKTVTFPGVVNNGTTSFKYDFSVPQIFTVDKIMLKTPAKNQLTLSDNPLQLFDFPQAGGISLSDWRIIGSDSASFSRLQTQRYPAASDAVKSMNAAINKNREGGTNQIMNMISDPAYNQYGAFATDSASSGPSGSLEGIHGNYHVLIGGPAGHMSRVPVAAFDPMFWLHHCQIDRWFAVWQAAHPNAWFTSDQTNQLPFRTSKSPEQFWTARGSRTTDAFGYTYPDLAGGAGQVKSTFRNHYSWSVRTAAQPKFGEPPADMAPLDISKAQVFQFTTGSTVASAFHTLLAAPIKQVPELVESAKAIVSKETAAKPSKESEHKNPAHEKGDAKDKAFRIAGSNDQIPITALSAVKESEVSREWFVDNIVER